MKKIDRAIAFVEQELKYVSDPGEGMDSEYYIKCAAKEDILDEVLYRLEQIKKGA